MSPTPFPPQTKKTENNMKTTAKCNAQPIYTENSVPVCRSDCNADGPWMMSVPTATVSAMPCTMYCDSGNTGTLSLTSATFTISCSNHSHTPASATSLAASTLSYYPLTMMLFQHEPVTTLDGSRKCRCARAREWLFHRRTRASCVCLQWMSGVVYTVSQKNLHP